jgi:hypothetical protein
MLINYFVSTYYIYIYIFFININIWISLGVSLLILNLKTYCILFKNKGGGR